VRGGGLLEGTHSPDESGPAGVNHALEHLVDFRALDSHHQSQSVGHAVQRTQGRFCLRQLAFQPGDGITPRSKQFVLPDGSSGCLFAQTEQLGVSLLLLSQRVEEAAGGLVAQKPPRQPLVNPLGPQLQLDAAVNKFGDFHRRRLERTGLDQR